MEDNKKETEEQIHFQEINEKKSENLVYSGDSPELQSKNIYVNKTFQKYFTKNKIS